MAIVFVVLMGVLLFHPTNTQPGGIGENSEDSVQWVSSQPVEVAVNWNEKSFTQVVTSPANTSAVQATATGGNK